MGQVIKSFKKSFVGASFCALGVLLASEQGLASFTTMPKSRVDAYRIKSQYGPEVGMLNPLFPKDQKVEVSVLGAWSPFSSLQNYWAYGGALTYHINRRHAIEPVWFQINSATRTNFVDSQIRDPLAGAANNLSVSLPQWSYAASYVFTPFYSKMQITEMNVAHIDVYASAGVGVVKTRLQSLVGENGAESTNAGAALGLGLRLLVPYRWGLRVDLKNFTHKAENFEKSALTNTLQLSAGLSVFFGSFPDYTSL